MKSAVTDTRRTPTSAQTKQTHGEASIEKRKKERKKLTNR